MTEILNVSDISCMQLFVDELDHQTSEKGMQINTKKTKEMFISSTLKDLLPSVTLRGETVERVATLKLFGLHVSKGLKWAQHIKTKRFFRRADMSEYSSCFYYLLNPDKRNSDILNKLRCLKICQPLTVNTVRFRKSFLPYCLHNYQ